MKNYALSFLLLLILFTVFCLLGGLTYKIDITGTGHSISSKATNATWTSIEVSREAGDGMLRWKTGNTRGVDCFVVERSVDGRNFESLGHIRAIGTDQEDFTFRDPSLVNQSRKRVYYRLRQIDQNGLTVTSPVRKLMIPEAQQVRLAASEKQVADQLTIRYFTGISSHAQMNVIDESGNVVLHHQLPAAENEQELNIPVEDWTRGTYVIQLFNANSQAQYPFTII